MRDQRTKRFTGWTGHVTPVVTLTLVGGCEEGAWGCVLRREGQELAVCRTRCSHCVFPAFPAGWLPWFRIRGLWEPRGHAGPGTHLSIRISGVGPALWVWTVSLGSSPALSLRDRSG